MWSRSLSVVRDFLDLLPQHAFEHGVHEGPDEIRSGEINTWTPKINFYDTNKVVVNFEKLVCSGTVLLECSYTLTEEEALTLYADILDRYISQ